MPTRINVDQVLGTHLSWAAKLLRMRFTAQVLDGIKGKSICSHLKQAELPEEANTHLYDGRTSNLFEQEFMLRYICMMAPIQQTADKVQTCAVERYSLVPPINSMQREEPYLALKQNLRTVKSNDSQSHTRHVSITNDNNASEAGIPESINVFLDEIQSPGLDFRTNCCKPINDIPDDHPAINRRIDFTSQCLLNKSGRFKTFGDAISQSIEISPDYASSAAQNVTRLTLGRTMGHWIQSKLVRYDPRTIIALSDTFGRPQSFVLSLVFCYKPLTIRFRETWFLIEGSEFDNGAKLGLYELNTYILGVSTPSTYQVITADDSIHMVTFDSSTQTPVSLFPACVDISMSIGTLTCKSNLSILIQPTRYGWAP